MQISFKIYKNLHKCKWVIRREKVTGVGLTVQRLRMGLGRARMWSMLRKLLKGTETREGVRSPRRGEEAGGLSVSRAALDPHWPT